MSGVRPTGSLTMKIVADRLARVNTPAARRELSKKLAADALRMTLEGFRRQQNPYGKAWRGLSERTKQRKKSSKALLDTGNLRGSIVAVPVDNGFKVETTVDYAGVHQYGSRDGKIPQRQMIPMAETGGIPERWVRAFNAITRKHIRDTVAGNP